MSCINSWLSPPLSVSQWEPVWKTLNQTLTQPVVDFFLNFEHARFLYLRGSVSSNRRIQPAWAWIFSIDMRSNAVPTPTKWRGKIYMISSYSLTVAQLFWCIGQILLSFLWVRLSFINKSIINGEETVNVSLNGDCTSLSRITKTFKSYSDMVLRKAQFVIFEPQTMVCNSHNSSKRKVSLFNFTF